jgi:hypothetical protein
MLEGIPFCLHGLSQHSYLKRARQGYAKSDRQTRTNGAGAQVALTALQTTLKLSGD